MPEINIGNRVKMLKDTMQGVVQRVGSDGVITIETDEGFEIPVMASELVLIAEVDKATSQVQMAQVKNSSDVKGFYFCGSKDSKAKVQLFIVNNESSDKLVVLSKKGKDRYTNYLSTKIEANTFYKVPGIYNMNEVETWNRWLLQVIPYNSNEPKLSAFEAIIHVKSKKLFLAEEPIPFLNEKGLLLKIEAQMEAPLPLKQVMRAERKDVSSMTEIDIHSEALGLDHGIDNLSNLQFEAFLKHFEDCIAYEVPKFTVIHGTGKGVLKNRIHKFLSKNENVRSFKESKKDHFGYGATDVTLS